MTKTSKAKKPAAKKPVAKKAVAKKPVAKKPAAKKPAAQKTVKRVPPQIVRHAPSVDRPVAVAKAETATDIKAFAMSIAEEMKRSASLADRQDAVDEIRLAKRPTSRTHGQTTICFPDADLEEFRARLLAARDVARNGVSAMMATGFNEADDHESDGGDGTNQTLRLQALGQMGNINRTLQQIEEALHRIDDGSYGVCTVCGQLIRKPRLLNQPFVLTCMECQSEMERNRR